MNLLPLGNIIKKNDQREQTSFLGVRFRINQKKILIIIDIAVNSSYRST